LHDYVHYIRNYGDWDLTGADRDLKDVLDFYQSLRDDAGIELSQSVTVQAFQELEEWVDMLPPQSARDTFRGKVFFDWDRVLNLMEGMFIPPPDHHLPSFTYREFTLEPSGYAKVCFGTKARYLAFKRAVSHMIRKNVEVNIVTNNTTCSNDDENSAFHRIAKALDPRIVVHCCKDFRNKALCIDTRGITNGVSFGKRRKNRKHHVGMFVNHGKEL